MYKETNHLFTYIAGENICKAYQQCVTDLRYITGF